MTESMDSKDDEDGLIQDENRPLTVEELSNCRRMLSALETYLFYADDAIFFDRSTSSGMISPALESIVSILSKSETDYLIEPEIRERHQELMSALDEEGTQRAILPDSVKEELVSQVSTWESMFVRQLEDETRIPIRKAGLFDSEEAMEEPHKLFPNKEVWESLPESVKRDISEACRSVAVNNYTSTVFLSLRAVEKQLHDWYIKETGREIEDRTFGQVLGEIDDQYDDGDKPQVLDHLKYLVDRRNEVAHPDQNPNQHEAENTLMMTRTTISNISEKLAGE